MTDIGTILDEINEYSYRERQAGDLSKWDIMDYYRSRGMNMSERRAFRLMDKMANRPGWISLQVYDPEREHVIRVIRKANNGQV